MKIYQEIKARYTKNCDDLIKQHQVFFAFNQKQLEEGKADIGITDNKDLVSICAGGFLPRVQAPLFARAMDEAEKAYKAELRAAKEARDGAILYELNNHECYYTGDIAPVIALFAGVYTPAEINQVYRANQQ